MKKILIVGPNSFIAKAFMDSLDRDKYETLSVRGDYWESYDYSGIDTIVYFAAIVHHPEINDEKLYEEVNAYKPYRMAQAAVRNGVRKFIYISTVAVYGKGPKFGDINRITKSTPLNPTGLYGKSKMLGERLLSSVGGLIVQIVRLPNVYGADCPGTFYHRLEMLSRLRYLPVYKDKYKFTLISVKNVAVALNRLLPIMRSGVYIPQDAEILSIVDRIKKMASMQGIRQSQINCIWPLLWLANKILPKKYTDNLYGGYYVDPMDFPVLTD